MDSEKTIPFHSEEEEILNWSSSLEKTCRQAIAEYNWLGHGPGSLREKIEKLTQEVGSWKTQISKYQRRQELIELSALNDYARDVLCLTEPFGEATRICLKRRKEASQQLWEQFYVEVLILLNERGCIKDKEFLEWTPPFGDFLQNSLKTGNVDPDTLWQIMKTPLLKDFL